MLVNCSNCLTKTIYTQVYMILDKQNECTKVQNSRRTRILEFARARSLITLTGSIRKTFGRRRRINRKKLLPYHRVVFQVEFSLLLAFLGPLEGSAIEKVRGMLLQYLQRRKWRISTMEQFQRNPQKFFDLRCPLST